MEQRERTTRCEEYRDLLERWAAWWDNVGRYAPAQVLPPLTDTSKALACTICQGERAERRCAACGRQMRDE